MCPEGCWKQTDSSEDVSMGPDGLRQTPNEADGSWCVLTRTGWLQTCVDGYRWSVTVSECGRWVPMVPEWYLINIFSFIFCWWFSNAIERLWKIDGQFSIYQNLDRDTPMLMLIRVGREGAVELGCWWCKAIVISNSTSVDGIMLMLWQHQS